MKIAVFPGSFDPITLGHLDIIERAVPLFDKLIIAIGQNSQKKYMFPAEVKLSKKKTILVELDEGVTPTTAEGLAKLPPAEKGGIHSFGAQTFPADGNVGFSVTLS